MGVSVHVASYYIVFSYLHVVLLNARWNSYKILNARVYNS